MIFKFIHTYPQCTYMYLTIKSDKKQQKKKNEGKLRNSIHFKHFPFIE